MADRPRTNSRSGLALSRRRWLIGSMLGTLGLAASARGGPAAPADEEAEIRAVGRKAGLDPFRVTETEHYLGIGDAPDAFRDQALRICKELAAIYQKHFHDKGFVVNFPGRRLTVVTLKSQASYGAFLGEDAGEIVGGHYDLDTNRLVIFDNRPRQSNLAAPSERINTFTLVHEALHQLTYNTGLLDRRADVPVALSEGLAMYGELWQPNRRAILGQTNRPRLQVLIEHSNKPEDWIPVGSLLSDDTLFHNKSKQQLAYAVAWVLVHFHLKTPSRLPKFRAYFDAIRSRRDSADRLNDAQAHLGSFDRLDTGLRKHAARLIREGW
jgi:hypothetical protein